MTRSPNRRSERDGFAGGRKRAKRLFETRPINRLRPHPQQAELFGDLAEPELQELAADMQSNGLNHAIEILSDGTIIAGHQRVRAAKLQGWTDIRCWVRIDLEKAGAAAIEERLVEDNLHRRHLDELQIARCYRRLKQLQQDEPASERVRGDVRDRLAERFGYSGRQLDRLTRLLELPIELQRAYSDRALSQTTALKLAALPGKKLQRIAERVAGGDKPEQVAAEYLVKPIAPSKKIGTAISRFISGLRRSIIDLENRLADFRGGLSENDRRILRKGRLIAKQLLTSSADDEESHLRPGELQHPAKSQAASMRSASSNRNARRPQAK